MGQRHFGENWTVIRVEIPWDDQRNAAQYAIMLSQWCKEQGLVDRKHYNWQFKPSEQVSVFYFEDHVESYATLFQLKWGDYSK